LKIIPDVNVVRLVVSQTSAGAVNKVWISCA